MLYEKNNNLPNKEQLNSIIIDFIDANNCCKQQANILKWLNSSEYYDAAPEQRNFIKKYLDKILNDNSIEVESSFDSIQDSDSYHDDKSDIVEKHDLNKTVLGSEFFNKKVLNMDNNQKLESNSARNIQLGFSQSNY
ncbi:hypothetical protein [Rickettsiella massiliensis]|uniref:hypothetical protein n=1 Tax=Rickettsiella massiliensis TaxID=676517 RepID=UPI00029A62F7|nr:hypothetical protein [Rickettsiella massiliensis]